MQMSGSAVAGALNWPPYRQQRMRVETQQLSSVKLRGPETSEDIAALRDIFLEYARDLGVDLCFQDFDKELAHLPGEYAPPRGALLMAMVDGKVAGCCALRPLDTADY